jgi:hypothetical protein
VLVSSKRDLAATRRFFIRAANNPVEADHGRMKARLRPMRGPETAALGTGDQCRTRVRPEPPRGHYEPGVDIDPQHRLTAIFVELARAI